MIWRRSFLLVVLLAIVPARARAKCAPDCLSLMCDRRSTVVSGTLQPEVAGSPETVLVVEAVLRLADGARAPKAGDRLSASVGTTSDSGPVVGFYETADLSVPMGIFPVGADGIVQCHESGEISPAPAGKGVTPVRLAELSGRPDFRECQSELEKAGYRRQFCDDTPSSCAATRGASHPPAAPLLAIATLMLLVLRRRSLRR